MITPKSVAKEGYKDVGMDDHIEEGYFKRTQEIQLDIIEDKWEVGWSKGRTHEGAKKEWTGRLLEIKQMFAFYIQYNAENYHL